MSNLEAARSSAASFAWQIEDQCPQSVVKVEIVETSGRILVRIHCQPGAPSDTGKVNAAIMSILRAKTPGSELLDFERVRHGDVTMVTAESKIEAVITGTSLTGHWHIAIPMRQFKTTLDIVSRYEHITLQQNGQVVVVFDVEPTDQSLAEMLKLPRHRLIVIRCLMQLIEPVFRKGLAELSQTFKITADNVDLFIAGCQPGDATCE